MLVYWDSRNIMNPWTLLDGFLILLTVASHALPAATQMARNKTDSEKTVVLRDLSEYGHQLPEFDPVVDYVGGSNLLAPPVDYYGNALCVSKPGDTYCEKVNYYPHNEIRKAIHYSPEQFKEIFGTQTINPWPISGDEIEETLCSQQARLFYPQAAVNENDQWTYVVNDVEYVQAVMSEVCENEDKPCSYLDGALPSGVSSYCRQKYAFKRLLALNPNDNKTIMDSFKFPSCCVCIVKKTFLTSKT